MDKKTLQELLEAGLHFGHKKHKWNPKMKPYIWGAKDDVHIFDLVKTAQKLEEALQAIAAYASQGKTLLLVGTKLQARQLLKKTAEELKLPYVDKKWLPGLLTNFATLKSRIKYYKQLQEEITNGQLEKYSKKERISFQKELAKLTDMFEGVQDMLELPDALFIIDVFKEKLAVKEASKLKIPVIAIVDSNGDPDQITYLIPANDDAIKGIRYLLAKVQSAFQKGRSNPLKPKVEQAEALKAPASNPPAAGKTGKAKTTAKKPLPKATAPQKTTKKK